MSERQLFRVNRVLNLVEAGSWMARHGHRLPPPARDRYELFSRTADEIADLDVLYLEFGVGSGGFLRYWSRLLRNPASKLHGFDTFEGMPRPWAFGGGLEAGAFSTGGVPPTVDDERARFFKGDFAETLPAYEWPEHEQLLVVCDAGLYSSTVTMLDGIEDRLVPGALLYFDDFFQRADEMRAFDEFLEATGMRFEALGASADLKNVMFRRR